ncbi:MAG: site-specific tyrosine recombinase XerD [Planctomycetes bacterium]|nr:site-specific tyrosine recombinase XerD [Planctomycetota bacterium]
MKGKNPKTAGSEPEHWPYSQIQPYLDYLSVECGLSKNTIDAYRRDLGRFSAFCDSHKLNHPDRIAPVDLQKFSKWISHERLSTSSIGRHISAVRMFFRFHLLTGQIDQDASTILELPKTWQLLPKVLNHQQVTELLAGTDASEPLHLRNSAILELLYATGMRASEIANLLMKNVNYSIGYLRCIGKGQKERIIPVHQRALDAVKSYVEQLRPELAGEKFLEEVFLSRTGRPVSRIEIWRIVRKSAKRAGLTGKIGPHILRHCFGSHLLQGGADLRSVQEMLGHADVTTTQIYTHVDQQHLRNIHRKYHPRA